MDWRFRFRARLFAALAICLAATLPACMNEPRNDKRVQAGQTLKFQGITTAFSTVRIEARRPDGGWDLIGQGMPSSSDPFIEGNLKWYKWEVNTRLPAPGASYWRANARGKRERPGFFRATQGSVELATFDAGADSCWYNTSGSTWTKIDNCKSKDSPVVRLWTPCGATGQACCDASSGFSCDPGSVCNGTCTTCGGRDQLCCGGNSCGQGLECRGGKCDDPCGDIGEECCGGSQCSGSLECRSGSCQTACGGSGESCCPGSRCDSSSLECNGGTCQQRCGGQGEPCCGGSSCEGSLQCNGGLCQPPPPRQTGEWYQAVCYCNENNQAFGATLAVCGDFPPPLSYWSTVCATTAKPRFGIQCDWGAAPEYGVVRVPGSGENECWTDGSGRDQPYWR